MTWTVTGPGCAGASCGTFTNVTSTSATYVAPASVSASLSVTVTATSVAQPTQIAATSTFSVMPPPSIVTTNLPTATPTYIYNTTLTAAGGVQPLNWSLASGVLPKGLTLNSAGTIYGTPTTGGTSSFTLKVTDSSGAPGGALSTQQAFSLTVVGILTVPRHFVPECHGGHSLQCHPPLYRGNASFDLEHLQRQSAFGTGVAGKHGGDFRHAYNPGFLLLYGGGV